MGVDVSICEAGRKFFWCVCDWLCDRPLACGHADTLDEAEEQVWAQAAIHRRGVRPEQVGDWLARRVRREVWQQDFTRPTGEMLYTDCVCDHTSGWGSTPHPVVRKTAKRVFVPGCVGRLVALDRGVLEAEGEVYNRRTRKHYYTQPYEVRFAGRIAEERRAAEERRVVGERRQAEEVASFSEAELRVAAEVARRAGVTSIDPLGVAQILRCKKLLAERGTARQTGATPS